MTKCRRRDQCQSNRHCRYLRKCLRHPCIHLLFIAERTMLRFKGAIREGAVINEGKGTILVGAMIYVFKGAM